MKCPESTILDLLLFYEALIGTLNPPVSLVGFLFVGTRKRALEVKGEFKIQNSKFPFVPRPSSFIPYSFSDPYFYSNEH